MSFMKDYYTALKSKINQSLSHEDQENLLEQDYQ